MDISGTTPLPPATSSTGPGGAGSQTNQPPIGPRSSSGYPGIEHVGQVGRDLAVLEPLHGQLEPVAGRAAEAIEYERWVE